LLSKEGRKHSHIPNVVPLGVLIETARRHVVDHALAQRADRLVEHRESSCLAWGSKPHDLETERRLALPRPPNPHADARRPPRERFSPEDTMDLSTKLKIAAVLATVLMAVLWAVPVPV
jgi:hypothetical protein